MYGLPPVSLQWLTFRWTLLGRSSRRSMTVGPVGCFSDPSVIDDRSEYRTRCKFAGNDAGVCPNKSPISDAIGDGGAVRTVSPSPGSSDLRPFGLRKFGTPKHVFVPIPFIFMQCCR